MCLGNLDASTPENGKPIDKVVIENTEQIETEKERLRQVSEIISKL